MQRIWTMGLAFALTSGIAGRPATGGIAGARMGGRAARTAGGPGCGEAALLAAARDRLRLLGMPEALIKNVEQSGKPHPRYTVTLPRGGLLQALDVRAGMTVMPGQALARVNGLATVWLEAAVPEGSAALVRVGNSAEARLAGFPDQPVTGRVTAILPVLSEASRSLRVRVELPNRDGRLRPGLFARVGKGAWLEEAIAHDLTNSAKQGTAASWYHLRAVVEGVRIDIAHHASMGGLPWTQANAANKLAAKTIFQYADQYKQPTPDLVIRSHNHRYADSGSNFHTRAIFTPCWSLSTEYGFRNGHENDLPHIGGMLISCQDGSYTYDGPVMYRPAESKRLWALKI